MTGRRSRPKRSFKYTVKSNAGTFERTTQHEFHFAVVYVRQASGRPEVEGICYAWVRTAEHAEQLAQDARDKGYEGVEVVPVTSVREAPTRAKTVAGIRYIP